MTNTTHTPGPWVACNAWSHEKPTGAHTLIHRIGYYSSMEHKPAVAVYAIGPKPIEHWCERDEIETKANAHLIAAAPEMLEALQLCRWHMYEHASNTPDNAFEKLCAAIAKATNPQTGNQP